MNTVGLQVDAAKELRHALASETALTSWLETRGYVPEQPGLPAASRKSLLGGRAFHAPAFAAPRLLVLWRPEMAERAVHGNQLRALQQDANQYVTRLRAEAAGVRLPDVCVVATSEYLLLFALDGNAFSRRLRFTPERVRVGTPLESVFRAFSAAYLSGMRQAPPARTDAVLDSILGGEDAPGWDFSRLFVGGKLDEDFVLFMSNERRRIAGLLVEDPKGKALLKEMWPHLKEAARAEDAGARMPPLAELVSQGRFRHALVASVDTVLLRLVLYRYLEAQFGYQQSESEQRQLAFGSYDELLEQTTRFDSERLAGLMKRIRAGDASAASLRGQMDLFAAPVRITQEKAFVKGVRERAGRYQAVAGGDLHHGSVAEAASLLQEFLLEHHSAEFALLLEGTRTSQYSFHYADLDPRAFQRFYEDTIGTDLRVTSGGARGADRVGVVEFERNRKEQGAYFTREQLCAWLAERTLGRTFDDWLVRVGQVIKVHEGNAGARLGALRALLDEMFDWKVIDPTCGGGIFLRAAFELLSSRRERARDFLRDALPREAYQELTAHGRYHLLSEETELGEWEWHILLHMLYGVDVDVKAINVASNLLTLSALSYKRHGLCFPSFVNTSLKRGNALVPLLRPSARADFASACGKELKRLIQVRAQLRDPKLPRSAWTKLHREAADTTRNLTQAYIAKTFKGLFDGLSERKLIERVQEVGVFFYEAEFPEAFFNEKGQLLKSAGFDIVLGNPPWEEPAAQLKQFLPEFDPEFRTLSGQRAQKREQELLRNEDIAARWTVHEQSVADYKELLTAGWYEHQQRAVQGRLTSAHTNLYKYATEVSWKLLKEGGRAGLVLDGGLWGDLAASGLRALLLDHSSEVQCCGFTNTEGIFSDIDGRTKFGANVFRRGGRLDALRAVFMREKLEDLELFDRIAFDIPADEIRHDARDSYPVPEARSTRHLEVDRQLSRHPALQGAWAINVLGEELNAGRQRSFFRESHRDGDYPLISGEQFNLFGVQQGALPGAWIDPGNRGAGGFLRDKQTGRILMAIADYLETHGRLQGTKKDAAAAWVKALTGKRELPVEWMRLDWDSYRIAWRDIARNQDRRTLIAAILPKHVAVTDKAPFVRPFAMRIDDKKGVVWRLQYEPQILLYLTGMLSSFACDSLARSRVTKATFKPYLFKGLNVPAWEEGKAQRRIAELTARLTCVVSLDRPWADYSDLAKSVGLSPKRDGLVDPKARWDAEVELNALAAQVYGLGRSEFRFIMDLLFMTPEHKDSHALMRDDIGVHL